MDVQPTDDLLNATVQDTFTLHSFIVREDSITSDETSSNLLGSYHDPVFGKTAASIYTQFATNSIVFGTPSDLVIDSVVLSMAYTGTHYGTLETQNVKVYQITQDFYKDSVYYSNRTLSYNTTPVANYDFIPNLTDSVKIGTINYKPQLRIRLDNTFGQNFLAQGNFADNPSFLSFFKGLYITADNPSQAVGQGAIFNVNLTDAQSKITLYYHNTNTSVVSQFSFQPISTSARFTHFTHDYTGTPIANQLADVSQGANLIYVQPMAGIKTKIELPYLNKLSFSNAISVHKAELVIKVDPTSVTTNYAPPAKLVVVYIDENGKSNFLSDIFEDVDGTSTYFGGTYTSSAHEYRFNIARHVQAILSGAKGNKGLYILPTGSAVLANRMVAGGSGNATYKMKLKLTYTKL